MIALSGPGVRSPFDLPMDTGFEGVTVNSRVCRSLGSSKMISRTCAIDTDVSGRGRAKLRYARSHMSFERMVKLRTLVFGRLSVFMRRTVSHVVLIWCVVMR